jgi:hypothetical protein
MTWSKRRFASKDNVHSLRTIEEAWTLLAVNVLLLAIEDVRANKEAYQRIKARHWLLSPAARFMADAVMDVEFDWEGWVLADCPVMAHYEQRRDKATNKRRRAVRRASAETAD